MVIRELFAKLGLDVDGAGFKAAESLIGGVKVGLFGLLAGAGAAVGGLLELGRETANAAVDAGRLAQRLGTTTDAAQELAFAAEATGSSAESLQVSMFHMSRAIEAAKEGSEEGKKALSGLGVPLADLVKMQPDKQFEAIAGGLSKMKEQGAKATKEQAIFGRGVLSLLPLIERGAEGIAQLRSEAQELGIVLSKDTIAEAKEWKMQMRITGAHIDALKYKVGAFVIHGIVKMSRAWKAFQKVHAEVVLGTIRSALLALIPVTLAWAAVNAMAAGEAAVGFGAAALAAVTAAGAMVGAWLLAAAPVVALGVVIAGLIAGLDDVYHWIKGDKASLMGKFFGDFGKSAETGFKGFLANARIWFGEFLNGLIFDAGQAGARMFGALFRDTAGAAGALMTGDIPGFLRAVSDVTRVAAETGAAGLAPPTAGPVFSPAALAGGAAGSTVSVSPTMSATVNINAQPGMDTGELAGKVREVFHDVMKTMIRETMGAVE